jgi:hypothetical protein
MKERRNGAFFRFAPFTIDLLMGHLHYFYRRHIAIFTAMTIFSRVREVLNNGKNG